MPERHWRMRVGLATSVLALALLVGPVTSLVSHAAWRPRLPLGLDLYMPVPETTRSPGARLSDQRRLGSPSVHQ